MQKDAWSLPPAPGTELLKPRDFLSGKGDGAPVVLRGPTGVSVGLGGMTTKPGLEAWNFQPCPPASGKVRSWSSVQSPVGSGLLSHLQCESPTESPEQRDAEGLGQRALRGSGRASVGRAPCPPPCWALRITATGLFLTGTLYNKPADLRVCLNSVSHLSKL